MVWLKKNWLLCSIISILIASLVIQAIQTDRPMAEADQEDIPQELQKNTDSVLQGSIDQSSESGVTKKIFVDIKGEVRAPDVYQVEGEKRVSDLIELAGGFTKGADTQMVNLAQKVFDEMVIHVPKRGELNEGIIKATVNGNSKIKINHASKEEIMSLSGIGEVKAEAIIQYREQNGYFQSEDDLLQVSGIGNKTLEQILEKIQIP